MQNSQPRLAHDVSSEMSKRDLGPLALGSWVSGVLQSDRRCNLGDRWEGNVPVGNSSSSPQQSPDPSDS